MEDIFSSPSLLALVSLIFFVGGFVKGVIGIGLPNIAIGSLTLLFGIYPAILLTLFPMLISNIVQAFDGPYLKAIIKRLWTFLLAAWILTYLSSQLLKNPGLAEIFSLILGILLTIYALLILFKKEVTIRAGHERVLSPLVGAVNGVITGVTGTVMVPSAFYLKGLGFQKDMLVQAMGIVFGSSTVLLILSLGTHDMLQKSEAIYSIAAVIPTMIGLFAGRRVRAGLSQDTFTKLFLYALIALGALIIVRSAFKML